MSLPSRAPCRKSCTAFRRWKRPALYLASIPLSQAHRLTRTNQQALLAHEWPEGWFMQTETAFLLLLPGTGDAAQPEQLLQNCRRWACAWTRP